MTDPTEVVARAIAPSRWAVMDDAKASMLRKHKGQNIEWPAGQFQDGPSMRTARAAIAALKVLGWTPPKPNSHSP